MSVGSSWNGVTPLRDMSNLRAVFWDVDGTLADTEMEGHRVAFNAAFAEAELPWHWDRHLYANLLQVPGGGQRIRAYALQQGKEIDEELLSQLRSRKQHHYLERIRSGNVPWRPGVRRLVNELQFHGVQQWIVTSSGRDSVNALLEISFTSGDVPFQGCITAEDVACGKPHPEGYLSALSLSGSEKDEVIVIEDSAAGFSAARAANLPCLLTPSPWDQELKSELSQANAALDNLGEVSLPCKVIVGPPCLNGLVTLEYLQDLIVVTRQ